MNSRFFAFGCSYVNYKWLTLSDLIGVNFDKYYNFGKAGCCNTYIANSVLKADELYNFTDTDYALVGVTGIRRFSFFQNDTYILHGDIFPRNTVLDFPGSEFSKLWSENYENYTWALKRTLTNLKYIRFILDTKNLRYKIYKSFYDDILDKDSLKFNPVQKKLLEQINNLIDIPISIDEIAADGNQNYFYNFIEDNDGHPTAYHHYRYLKKHFPEFDTINTQKIYQKGEENFNLTSSRHQSQEFNKFIRPYRQNIEDSQP